MCLLNTLAMSKIVCYGGNREDFQPKPIVIDGVEYIDYPSHYERLTVDSKNNVTLELSFEPLGETPVI